MGDELDEAKQLITQVREKVFAAADTIDCCTVPMCLRKESQLHPDRSGVLMQVGPLHFVVTAAHLNNEKQLKDAMDHGYDPCVIMPEKELLPMPLVGAKYLSTKDRTEDVTVILLNDHHVKQLNGHYRFLRLTDVAPLHTLHPGGFYLINGFPMDLIQQEPSGRRSEVWRYLTGAYAGDLADIPTYNPEIHLALHYERNSYSRDGARVGPKGMSGCGIWHVADGIAIPHVSPDNFKLIGIQTAWHPQLEYAIGTRIRLVLYIIWRYYSDSRDIMRFHGIEF